MSLAPSLATPAAPLEAPLLDSSWGLPLDRPFLAATARGAGVSPHDLTALVSRRLVRQPVKGVYVAAQAPDSTALRIACLALVVPEDCVVVDRHAGWLHGAPMVLEPGEHLAPQAIAVFRPPGMGRLRNGLADSGERCLRPSDVTTVGGVRVTTALRTAWDLGRTRYPEPALIGIDAMLRLGVDKAELLDGIGWFARRRWVTTLREVAPLGDGRAESGPESVLRLRWLQAHLPTPVPQLPVETDLGTFFLDLGEPELEIGAEYDGEEWHSSPDQRAYDLGRRAAVARTGHLLEVFVRDGLFGPRADCEIRLRRLAARARERAGVRTVLI